MASRVIPAARHDVRGFILRFFWITTALLVGAVPLANWAEMDDRVAQITAIQSITTTMKNLTESLGLAEPYAWTRQQARALQHLRFGPPEDQ